MEEVRLNSVLILSHSVTFEVVLLSDLESEGVWIVLKYVNGVAEGDITGLGSGYDRARRE